MNDNLFSNKRTYFVISSIISVVFFIFFALLVIFVVFSSGSEPTDYDEKEVFSHQMVRLDKRNNHVSFGMVQIFDEIIEPEGFRYSSMNDLHTLISPFGSNEFHCTGSCYCDFEGRRASHQEGVIIKKGMTYLLAAFSSVIAFGLAKEHFQSDCQQRFSESCQEGYAVAEVEDCAPLVKMSSDEDEEEFDEFEGKVTNDPDPNQKYQGTRQSFVCTGSCLPRETTDMHLLMAVRDFQCENLKTSGEIQILLYHGEDENRLAELRFVNILLEPTCVLKSRKEVLHKWNQKEEPTATNLCVGKDIENYNPSVNCRKIGMLH